MSGFAQLAANLLRLSPELHAKHSRRAVDRAGKVIELRAAANALAGRNTGALSRAISHKTKMLPKKAGKAIGAICFIGPDRGYKEFHKLGRTSARTEVVPSNYAHIVERGSSRSAPKPFLRPALDGAKEFAEVIMANEMRAGLDEITNHLRP